MGRLVNRGKGGQQVQLVQLAQPDSLEAEDHLENLEDLENRVIEEILVQQAQLVQLDKVENKEL